VQLYTQTEANLKAILQTRCSAVIFLGLIRQVLDVLETVANDRP
jgi:hypothetical protein